MEFTAAIGVGQAKLDLVSAEHLKLRDINQDEQCKTADCFNIEL